jgi:hypothetical protein
MSLTARNHPDQVNLSNHQSAEEYTCNFCALMIQNRISLYSVVEQ